MFLLPPNSWSNSDNPAILQHIQPQPRRLKPSSLPLIPTDPAFPNPSLVSVIRETCKLVSWPREPPLLNKSGEDRVGLREPSQLHPVYGGPVLCQSVESVVSLQGGRYPSLSACAHPHGGGEAGGHRAAGSAGREEQDSWESGGQACHGICVTFGGVSQYRGVPLQAPSPLHYTAALHFVSLPIGSARVHWPV